MAKPKRPATKKKATRKKTKAAKKAPTRKKAAGKKAATKAAKKTGKKTRKAASGLIYRFGATTDGDASMRDLLGGKGANLAEMTSIGLPVPPGFTITTEACALYQKRGDLPGGLMDEVRTAIAGLEEQTGKAFGSDENPLLVSVRSGAAVSMPGMMDTVLNLGMTDTSVEGLAAQSGDERFAFDAYRRLIQMFGDVVMGVDHNRFEEAFETIKSRFAVSEDTDVPAEGMRDLCRAFKDVYQRHVGAPFPNDPYEQLALAIRAVFKSWDTPRAARYRRINNITGLRGTAVNVQTMVFGNLGEDSGTGVAFTRNPSTGADEFYGEFLISAQGEDVVAGTRTPRPLKELEGWRPKVYKALLEVRKQLEKHYHDMQDIEFTIERGRLYMLQTRTGKRTGHAAVRIACDMVREKRIDRDEALLRIPAGDLTQLLLPSFNPKAKERADLLARGLPASPGVAVGKPAFTAEEAVERAGRGEAVILVRRETSPEDIDGMHTARGILTSTGGMTSHAAVVARGWGKCCVAGAGAVSIDSEKGEMRIKDRVVTRDDVISLDGATGEVFAEAIETHEPEMSGDFATIMKWADERRELEVRTNADTAADARRAREFGAEGIGLCRTEHMFFGEDRIWAVREMILAESSEARAHALEKLLPFQRDDFAAIFRAMDGLPVTVRLLDPPLHEFLPSEEDALKEMARRLDAPLEDVRRRVHALRETNPMLGHRGCRLAVTYPEILRMQVTAIVEATLQCNDDGVDAVPEIMVPLISTTEELTLLRGWIEETINSVCERRAAGAAPDIPIGTMIEVPRAALVAEEIAQAADFFSFGTNDLTQLTFGFSRDDVNTFLPAYLERDLLPRDPFQSLDEDGVGRLVFNATLDGVEANPGLKVGICGEHGGDPASVAFCHAVGLDYVSCSPFRVPVARLAAAQAALRGVL